MAVPSASQLLEFHVQDALEEEVGKSFPHYHKVRFRFLKDPVLYGPAVVPARVYSARMGLEAVLVETGDDGVLTYEIRDLARLGAPSVN